ncbi:MAG TPA: ABC transporter ATP-binding protein [Gemmatimonadaceae bacterium]|nr:ABC transporter ATP-binding protein [Gemmatimonadaceae bacterium]
MIAFESVSKTYTSLFRPSVRAVEDFTLTIGRGEIMGLAGPNGAGKSTLISLLLGYLSPTAGRVAIADTAPRPYIERNGIGYLSEFVTLNPQWTAEGALERLALLAGVPDPLAKQRVEAVIDELGIAEHRYKKLKALSKGNLQRLGLAQALLRDERVLILDEPTHGLDPVWTQRFRDLVQGLRSPDRTILIASHNLDELERLCDRVAIIDRGRLQRVVETRRSAARDVAASYHLAVVSGAEHVLNVFPDARPLGSGEFEIAGGDAAVLNDRLGDLLARGARITALIPSHSRLEAQFREAVRSTSDPSGAES